MGAVTSPSSTASVSLPAAESRLLTPRRIFAVFGVAAAFAVSWYAAEVHPGELFSRETAAALWKFLSGLLPPDFSADFLRVTLKAVGQTLATAIASTLLSIVLGLPLGIMASAALWRHGILVEGEKRGLPFYFLSGLSKFARAFLGFVRAIPDILWAILFVTMVGLGPLAGTLALAVAYSGLIGRVYSEVFDTVDPQPLEALETTGAGRLQIFLRGIWPQALPSLVTYTLYSFECCVRAASVLGLVGAGGIGYEIGVSMRLFEYGQVLTLILAFIALLALTDLASRFVRGILNRQARRQQSASVTTASANLLGTTGDREASAAVHKRPPAAIAAMRRALLWASVIAAAVACFYFSGFTPEVLEETDVIRHAARFIGGLYPPELGWKFLHGLGFLVVQTFAIAYLGTIIGVFIAALSALPATASLIFIDPDSTGRHGIAERTVRWLAYWVARLELNLLRAIPELVWVLVCILAIGIGPFAGAIAIGVHTGGVLGKLYAEAMEEVPRRPIEALYALGARPLQVLARGIWPQAKPMLRNYTLLRWEANLRVSTILGLVGGGGLGQAIYNNIQLGFYDRVATMLVIICILVFASDWFGDRLRAADIRKPAEYIARE